MMIGNTTLSQSAAIQSVINPARSELFPSFQNKFDSGAKYLRPFLTLKSQYTFLLTLQESLNIAKQQSNENECKEIETFTMIIQNLKSSTLGKLFEAADATISELNKMPKSENQSPLIERTSICLLRVAVSIRHISTYLDANTKEDLTETPKPKDKSHLRLKLAKSSDYFYKTQSQPGQKDHEFIVCRICDELIPIEQFEKHTEFCIKAYKSETRKNEIIQQITKFKDSISEDKLHIPWVGNQEEMVAIYLPLLRVELLLQDALYLDPNSSDSIEDLNSIISIISKIECDQSISSLVNRAKKLLNDFLRVCKALKTLSTGLVETRYSKNPAPASLSTLTIADFDFVKRISSGAFASVFIAKKHTTGDIFAIKAIPKNCLNQKNQTKRVIAEKDILSSFSNPYIVTFYYSIIGHRNLYLVTEFVPGGDLYSLLQKVGAFDEDTSKIYISEILCALRYLRENSIIHRDIKPDNILIAKDGTLKLTDFGLSRQGIVNRQVNENEDAGESEIVGTLDYMAPEVLLNKPHTFAVDYWSLGAMIFEFLIGVPPFHEDSESLTTANILQGNILFEEDDDISPEARDLIVKLLEPDPVKRLGYRDIQEIFDHPWLKGVDPSKSEPPFLPELASETDTEFFEERYKFSTVTDNDIILDIQESSNMESSGTESDTSEISSFSSLSIENLCETNLALSKQFRRRRSLSPSPSESDDPLPIQPTIRRLSESKLVPHDPDEIDITDLQ